MKFQVVYIVSTDFPKCKYYFGFDVFQQTHKGEERTRENWGAQATELDEPLTSNQFK